MSAAFAVVVCVGLAVSVPNQHEPPPEAPAHVRAFEPELKRLIQEGIDRSPTFRRLVQQIDRSDGIVYVQTGTCSISAASGCLILRVNKAADTRYLHIHIPQRRLPRDERLAIIGHELQHANEVLSARWVRSDADVIALFHRIGSAESIRSFETTDAQQVGATIAEELQGRR